MSSERINSVRNFVGIRSVSIDRLAVVRTASAHRYYRFSNSYLSHGSCSVIILLATLYVTLLRGSWRTRFVENHLQTADNDIINRLARIPPPKTGLAPTCAFESVYPRGNLRRDLSAAAGRLRLSPGTFRTSRRSPDST